MIDILISKSSNKSELISKFMKKNDKLKLKSYYYAPFKNIYINDYIYLVSKYNLKIFKYGKITDKNISKISILCNNYTLHLNSDEYYFFKKNNKYNLFNDLINS